VESQSDRAQALLKNVTLRQLRAFQAVARHLHFGKAARELDLTAPAVSIQIRELEAQIGMPLFERHGQGKSLSLTVTGEFLLGYTHKIFSTLKEAKGAISQFRNAGAGQIAVGMAPTAKYIVPLFLGRFHALHPQLQVHLVESRGDELQHRLQTGELDLAVMSRPPRPLAAYAEAFAAYPMGFVVAATHALAASPAVPREMLPQLHFLVREPGSASRAAFDEFQRSSRLDLAQVGEVPSNEVIKQAVLAGLGVGFLNLHTVGLERRTGQLRVLEVEGTPLTGQWFLLRTPMRPLTPAAESLRQFILRQGQDLLAAHVDQPALQRAGTAGAAATVCSGGVTSSAR